MSNVPPKRGSSAMVEDEEDVDESALEFEKERRLDSKANMAVFFICSSCSSCSSRFSL